MTQPSSPPTYLAVLDFEATCADKNIDVGWDAAKQEIIELPVALLSVAERKVIATFESFVRPTQQPKLTAFCTALTTITDADLEGQPEITEVIERLHTWLDAHGVNAENTCVATCGDWDLKTMWPRQVKLVPALAARSPEIFRTWCNLKVVFQKHTGMKATGMIPMLERMGITHQGTHHRGIDDVRNLCALAVRLLEDGAVVGPTSPR